jgi:site-specific recombinase XerD
MARIEKVKKAVPETLEEALVQFLLWKKAQQISEQTLLDYMTHVNLFLKRCPQAVDSYELLEKGLFDHLGLQGIKPATYNNRLVYLRTFFNRCVEKNVLSDNPLLGIKKRKDAVRPVQIDEEAQIKLIQLPNRETYAGLRDYAMLLMFLDCL